jgi:dTMP kinase
VSFVVSIALIVRIPPRLLQSERALSRGHWRDLRDGFNAALRSASMRTVLVAWGIASLALGGSTVATIFMAKNTLSAGDFGYGLLYGATGVGLVLGSFASAFVLARFGVARVYGGGMLLMALGTLGVSLSPNVWVATVGCVVNGVGNGIAVTCNALLVQRGTFDLLRGRALTFVMSITYVLVGIGMAMGGAFLRAPVDPAIPRWIWAGTSALLTVAACAGFLLARNLGGETASEAETAHADARPVAAAN